MWEDVHECRLARSAGLVAVGCALWALPAAALAEYPDKPIRLIVPQAAGSATDTVARILAAELGPQLGQTRHRRGQAGRRAHHRHRSSSPSRAPDGYTLGVGPIGALAITRHMVAKLPYDIEKDFQPIALIARGHLMLAVSPKSDYQVGEGPDRERQGQSRQAHQRVVEQWLARPCRRRAVQVHDRHSRSVHVPYRGGAPAINDLIAGRVDLMFESLNSISSRRQVRPGQGARGERRAALAGVPGSADRRGGGRAGL